MIELKTVKHTARLARLTLTKEEKEILACQLGSILDYMTKLKELDTEDVEPFYYPVSIVTPLRDDCEHPSLDRKKVLENAPEHAEGFFKVPPTFEKETT